MLIIVCASVCNHYSPWGRSSVPHKIIFNNWLFETSLQSYSKKTLGKITRKARENTERGYRIVLMPPGHPIILLLSNSFNIAAVSVKRSNYSPPYAPVVSSKTIPNTRPKQAKYIPVFRPKSSKNHTLWGGTYLDGLPYIWRIIAGGYYLFQFVRQGGDYARERLFQILLTYYHIR